MNAFILWAIGGLSFIPVNWLKHLHGKEGNINVWYLSAFSVIIGLVSLLVTGELSIESFSLDDLQALLSAVGQIISAATLVYKLTPDRINQIGAPPKD